jgi:MoxR-like ATPase
MKADVVTVRCKACQTPLQVPAGGKRLCACGTWVAAPAAPLVSAEEPVIVVKPEEPYRPPVAAAAPPIPTATPAPAQPANWPRIEGDLSAIERLNDGYRRITKELSKAIVGQTDVIEQLLIAIFAKGHCLLVGVPGLAKTLMIRTLSDALNLSFSRIQFTPDLMPSDITGTEVLQEDKSTGQRVFKFLPGPIFSNVILADEINRTPPKTQAALLEAMQEKQVTIGGTRHKLPDPFFVLATQNPIEQEGTYPLPEAQQDRFMFNVFVDYPSEEEEFKIVEMTTATHVAKLERIISANEILEMQDIVRKVPVAPYVIRYAMKFARLTRKEKGEVPDFIKEYVTWGAGPRASQNLVLGAKARAVLHGRYYVSCEDIRAVAVPVLRHRIVTNFNAEAEGIKPETIIQRLADIIPRDPNEEALAKGKAVVTA